MRPILKFSPILPQRKGAQRKGLWLIVTSWHPLTGMTALSNAGEGSKVPFFLCYYCRQ